MTRRQPGASQVEGINIKEELIPLREFPSSDALKGEIRRRIARLEKDNWRVYEIVTQGAHLALRFRH